MGKLAKKGWLGITWPKELGGQDGEGVLEYLLNEQLAYRGGPQIGKGVGIIGKTLVRHGSDKLKAEFLPKILNAEVEFAVGYSEPQAGSDAANMQLRAVHDDERGGWVLNGSKIWTTSRTSQTGTGWVRAPIRTTSTGASRSFSCPWITRDSRFRESRRSATSLRTRSSSRTSSFRTTMWSVRSTAASSTSRKPSISSASRCSRTRPSSSEWSC